MKQLTEFQELSVKNALLKMLRSTHFSVSDFDAVAKLLGKEQELGGDDYRALRTMHCVDYADMKGGLDKMIKLKILELLGFSEEILKEADKKEESPPPTYYEAEHKVVKKPSLLFWR